MDDNFYVRRYRTGDEYEIVDLLQEVFKGWPKFNLESSSMQHWTWKYLENPLGVLIVVLVCRKDDGKIVGVDHIFPRKVKLGDKIITSSIATDTVVHESCRGRGLSKRMRELRNNLREEASIFFNYGGTANPLLIESSRKRGNMLFPHESTTLYRIKDVDLFLEGKEVDRQWIKKIGLKTLNLLSRARGSSISQTSSQYRDIMTIKKFSEDVLNFWSLIKHNYNFIRVQSQEYLNWRYCDVRGGKFHVKIVQDDGQLIGYIVLRINRHDAHNPEGIIVDLLSIPEQKKVVESLIADSIRIFDENDCNSIKIQVIRGHPLREVLKQFGFIDSRQVQYIDIPRTSRLHLGGLMNEVKMLQKWPSEKIHLTLGDYDSI